MDLYKHAKLVYLFLLYIVKILVADYSPDWSYANVTMLARAKLVLH